MYPLTMAAPLSFEDDLGVWNRILEHYPGAVPPSRILNKSMLCPRWATRYHAARSRLLFLPEWDAFRALASSGEDLSSRYAGYLHLAPRHEMDKTPEEEYPECSVCECRKRFFNLLKTKAGNKICYRCTRARTTDLPDYKRKLFVGVRSEAQIHGTVYFVSDDGTLFPPVLTYVRFFLFDSLRGRFNPHPLEVLDQLHAKEEVKTFLSHIRTQGKRSLIGCTFWGGAQALNPEEISRRIFESETPWIQDVTFSLRISVQ